MHALRDRTMAGIGGRRMRKILFRGKRKDNGEWIISSDICQPDYDEVYLWANGNWTEVYHDTPELLEVEE